MSSDARAVPALLLAIPLVATTIGLVGITVVDRVGGADDRRWLNSAEAAANGDAAEMLRFIDGGEDPTHVYPVREHIISSSVRWVTTLEAAVWARAPEVVQLLAERGALADPATRRHLACLAHDLEIEDMPEELNAGAPACPPGAAVGRVTARTPGAAR